MFWRMNPGLNASSTLEATLDRALGGNGGDQSSNLQYSTARGSGGGANGGSMHNVLDQLLDETDLLSELKAGNPRLIQVLSARDNVRGLIAWSVYGTDEIERHADTAERRILEDVVKQGGLPWPPSDAPGVVPSRYEGRGQSQQPDQVSAEASELSESPSSGVWGSFTNASPQPDLEGDAKRQRYPHLATEILCADYFQISETLWSDLSGLLGPMWDIILSSREEALGMPVIAGYDTAEDRCRLRAHVRYELDSAKSERDEEDEKRREIIRGNWTRINGMLLTKRPAQMLKFIQDIPRVVSRLVDRIDSPSVQDTILRMITCEEAGVAGVVEWLRQERLIPKLLSLLSPYESPSTHSTIAEVIKAIISLTSPNAFNPNGGNGGDSSEVGAASQGPNTAQANTGSSADVVGGTGETSNVATNESTASVGQRDNRLIRELVMPENIALLVEPMRKRRDSAHSDIGQNPDVLVDIELNGEEAPVPIVRPKVRPARDEVASYSFDPYQVSRLPSTGSVSSSFCQSINILIELIRKNNSDYSEPYLFHSIRNRLMGMQQRKVEIRFQAKDQAEQEDEHTSSFEEDAQDRQDMEDTMAKMSEKLGIVHLGPLLSQVSERIGELQDAILHARLPERGSIPGTSNPLTPERFRIVELYAEMLHCSNMSILNRAKGSGPDYTADGRLEGGLDALEQLGTALEGVTEADHDNDEVVNEVTPAKDLPVSSSGSTNCSLTGSDDEGEEPTLDPVAQTDSPEARSDMSEILEAKPSPNDEEDEPSTPKQMSFDDMTQATEKLQVSAESSQEFEARAVRRSSCTLAPADDVKRQETSPKTAVGDILKQMYIENRVLVAVVDLFFEHPSNNFLHNVIYDIVQQVLNGRIDQGYNRRLVCELFRDARIAEKILHTQALNTKLSQGHRSRRLGLMGHMLLIADEVEKFFERCPSDLYQTIEDSFVRSEWNAFVAGELKESRQRDAQPLGGGRPSALAAVNAAKQESDSGEEDEDPTGALAGQPLTRSASSGDAFSNSFGFGAAESDDSRFRVFNKFLTNETYSGSFASSDEDSDDSSESPRASRGGRQQMLSDGFENAFSPSSDPGEMDDGFGDFVAADPFGDSFEAPYQKPLRMSIHANRPMTAADFANQAFREQFAGESSTPSPAADDSDEDEDDEDELIEGAPTKIVVPGDDSFESAAQFLAANWSVPGGHVQTGEVLPPTTPIKARGGSWDDAASSSSTSSHGSLSSPSPGSSPEMIKSLHPAAQLGRRTSKSQALSPPDPSLVRATDATEPYGHGVSSDTTVREDGKLERNINGRTVTAPQDDISLAANHARKASR